MPITQNNAGVIFKVCFEPGINKKRKENFSDNENQSTA